MTKKSTRGGREYIFPRDLLQLMLIKMPHFCYTTELYSACTCCPDSYRSHFISRFSHPREDSAHAQKEESHTPSTATLVNVRRFTGEKLSNSIWPNGPSWPNHCVQLSSDQPSAQGFPATIHHLHTNLQDRVWREEWLIRSSMSYQGDCSVPPSFCHQ